MSYEDVLAAKGVTVLKHAVSPALHPHVCLGTSTAGGGKALYAKAPIPAGEWVWREWGDTVTRPYTYEDIDALPPAAKALYLHFSYCTWPGGAGRARGGRVSLSIRHPVPCVRCRPLPQVSVSPRSPGSVPPCTRTRVHCGTVVAIPSCGPRVLAAPCAFAALASRVCRSPVPLRTTVSHSFSV